MNNAETTALERLRARFEASAAKPAGLAWAEVVTRLLAQPAKLAALESMDATGGEPDLLGIDPETHELLFVDCAPESPAGRRSLCYDEQALESRKKAKPEGSALGWAQRIGAELLSPELYARLQMRQPFDTKTSSWLATPPEVRALGGALFGDYRYGRVFTYHNGAESYYAARGFRVLLRV